jgi:hypothetical protein
MNITDKACQINRGTLIAKTTAVEQKASVGEGNKIAGRLHNDLQELLDRCKVNLSSAQLSQVEIFLQKIQEDRGGF